MSRFTTARGAAVIAAVAASALALAAACGPMHRGTSSQDDQLSAKTRRNCTSDGFPTHMDSPYEVSRVVSWPQPRVRAVSSGTSVP